MNLKSFFFAKPQSSDRSRKDAPVVVDGVMDMDEDLPGNVQEDRKSSKDKVQQDNTPLQFPSHLPFFVNGCKAPGKLDL